MISLLVTSLLLALAPFTTPELTLDCVVPPVPKSAETQNTDPHMDKPREAKRKVRTQSYRKRIVVTATAYTAGPESTGKTPGHPAYGITASGKKARRGVTIAMDPSIPFGTKVYIPALAEWDGDGVFIVQDRGGVIKGHRVDIYFGEGQQALREARQFGRRRLEVFIIDTP